MICKKWWLNVHAEFAVKEYIDLSAWSGDHFWHWNFSASSRDWRQHHDWSWNSTKIHRPAATCARLLRSSLNIYNTQNMQNMQNRQNTNLCSPFGAKNRQPWCHGQSQVGHRPQNTHAQYRDSSGAWDHSLHPSRPRLTLSVSVLAMGTGGGQLNW